MKTSDIRKKTATELTKLLGELKEEVRDFRFSMSGGAKKNVRRARTVRRDIARIKTILTETKTP